MTIAYFQTSFVEKVKKNDLIFFSRKVSISLPNLCEYELLAPGQENADRKLDENDQLGLRVIASFGNHSVAIINFKSKIQRNCTIFLSTYSISYFQYKIYCCCICKKSFSVYLINVFHSIV